ncbi:hypothetical protein F4809DRAFT_644075 [Biscogniauxia mediterranea]|nr:hypothetical protein F4809DRAFT_644075 [Biscogniauxia mediterranea]
MHRRLNPLTLWGAVPLFAAVGCAGLDVPSLQVPSCPAHGTIQYSKSVPEQADFPLTQVDLCYDAGAIEIVFTALEEASFYYNESQGTNDPIYQYEVMEAFIHPGAGDPQTYLEFEVSPNNVTFQAFIFNPSRVRAPGAPFDTFYVADPLADGLTAATVLDRDSRTWTSTARVPLALFNVDEGRAQGTQWRMNFFRTVVDPATFPAQGLGAWNPTNQSNFHMTPFFGSVTFV